jgi:hypothetical protein
MRIPFFCTLLVIFAAGTALSQEINFRSGPQYLMIAGSPIFARSISTPEISLNGPPLEVGADNATALLIPGAQDHTVLPPNPDKLPVVDLLPIYYGIRPVSDIEVSFAGASSETTSSTLPASILDTGAGQTTTAQALRERGYGVSVAQAAAYAKAKLRPGTRIYTNGDIDRLRGGS